MPRIFPELEGKLAGIKPDSPHMGRQLAALFYNQLIACEEMPEAKRQNAMLETMILFNRRFPHWSQRMFFIVDECVALMKQLERAKEHRTIVDDGEIIIPKTPSLHVVEIRPSVREKTYESV